MPNIIKRGLKKNKSALARSLRITALYFLFWHDVDHFHRIGCDQQPREIFGCIGNQYWKRNAICSIDILPDFYIGVFRF